MSGTENGKKKETKYEFLYITRNENVKELIEVLEALLADLPKNWEELPDMCVDVLGGIYGHQRTHTTAVEEKEEHEHKQEAHILVSSPISDSAYSDVK